jgi:hypothetical protein
MLTNTRPDLRSLMMCVGWVVFCVVTVIFVTGPCRVTRRTQIFELSRFLTWAAASSSTAGEAEAGRVGEAEETQHRQMQQQQQQQMWTTRLHGHSWPSTAAKDPLLIKIVMIRG